MVREGGWISHVSLSMAGWMGLALVANAWLPPFILETWVRDADVGLWFCAGLYVTELALPSWIAIAKVGTLPQRWLLGATMAWLFIATGWLGFRFTGPISQKDAICFLAASFATPLLILATNHGLSFLFGAKLAMSPPREAARESWAAAEPTISEIAVLDREPLDREPLSSSSSAGVEAQEIPKLPPRPARTIEGWELEGEVRKSGHALSFGLSSLFAWIILAAATVSFCKQALGASDIAFRAIRITLVFESAAYTLMRVLYILWLQAMLLRWCFASRGLGRSDWWWILTLVLGLEGMRRVVSGIHGERLTYLEWDFAPLVLGVVVGQVCLALVLRWRGLILLRS
jgi:hypothetical protein